MIITQSSEIEQCKLICKIYLSVYLSYFTYAIPQYYMQQDSEKTKPLLQFSTGTTQILTTPRYNTQSLALAGVSSNESNLIPDTLELHFRFVLNDMLNACLKPRARLWEIWFNSLKVSVELTTREGEFNLETMNYFMFLEIKTNLTDQTDIVLTKVEQELRRTYVEGKIVLHREGNLLDELQMCNQAVLIIGSKNNKEIVNYELSHLSAQTFYRKESYKSPHNKIQNKIRFISKQYSLPVGSFTSDHQIYSALDITSNCSFEELEKSISALPQYSSRVSGDENKLFICHDMKGGYVQDLHFGNNIVPHNQFQNINYRCLHLQQAEIFNYFSHHSISVPPRHWRILCHRYNTLCLGTFITQDFKYSQQMLTSKQFALFLVAVARKCGFDGYLINIEREVKAITNFKKWLKFLTDKMHQFIPNSKIIWYDSISADRGAIEYQNALTKKNYQFFSLTDGIFTNYWWNEALLQQSLAMKKDSKKKVYIGNDCFGRNTYGGGKLNIYAAANKILEYKQLSIALFAPGWTYQAGGSLSRALLEINENAMYKGVKSIEININKWKTNKEKKNQVGGWNQEGQEVVASYGFNHLYNERSMVIGHPPLDQGESARVLFICRVKSTPAMANSPYKIILQVLNPTNDIIKATEGVNLNNCRKSKEEEQFIHEHIDVDQSQIPHLQLSVRIVIIAKSRQNWGGFYGPRFSSEAARVLVYKKADNWTSRVPINQVVLSSPYHSYCNTGVGDNFFLEGEALQPFYNFIADMDIPHTHIINSPLDTQFNYSDGFVGGNSLQINKESTKLIQMLIPHNIDLSKKYYIVVTVKNTHGINLTLKYKVSLPDAYRVFSANLLHKQQAGELGWTRYTFSLTTKLTTLDKDVNSLVQLSSIQTPFLLGQLKVISGQKDFQNIKCIIRPTKEVLHSDQYYLNLEITSQLYKRLLVVVGKVGMFVYFYQGQALLRNIPVPKCQQFSIRILQTDTCLQTNTIRVKNFNIDSIRQLIFKGSVAF